MHYLFIYLFFYFIFCFIFFLKSLLVACPTHRNPPGSGLGTRGIVFSSPGTNVLGELMPYPRRRRCHRRCRRRRCRRRRQFQVKVSVY